MSAAACNMEMEQMPADDQRKIAIRVRDGYKKYGNVRVLQDFNMTVMEGTIYGLLGASGCGKTTLLGCLVGRRRLDSGQVCVLGHTAGEKHFEDVRDKVGYMPQEVALYNTFTIKETLMYFGWIFNMTTKDVEVKLDFWLKVLSLPPGGSLVKNISGGQRRRLSLAVALLHDPEVLILDEPTVGVDPVLRSVIWEHLVHLSSERRRTIVITTHYIEEAKQAHKVGLIRCGRLLAEESPAALLRTYQSDSLEAVFTRLSEVQEQDFRSEVAPGSLQSQDEDNCKTSWKPGVEDVLTESYVAKTTTNRRSRNIISFGRMYALLYKNCTSLWKDISLMIFLFGQCLFLPTLIYYSFANYPDELHLAVVNEDRNSSGPGSPCEGEWSATSCQLEDMSCRFISRLTPPTFVTEFYKDTHLAEDAVRKGRAWGSLYFGENYTSALVERSFPDDMPSDAAVEQSIIDVRLDMTEYITSQHLRLKLYETYMEMLSDVAVSCGYHPAILEVPMKFKNPVYGHKEPRNPDFYGPASMIFIVHFFGVALSATSIVVERKEGLLDRNIIAGVMSLEIILAHFLAQFLVLLCQIVVLFTFGIYALNMECNGSPLLVLSLNALVGASGQLFGFAISAFTQSELGATILANGIVMPLMILSGIVWPLTGMYKYMDAVAQWLPLTLPVEAARSVTARGMSLPSHKVYMGFVGASGWCLVFTLLCVLSIKLNKL